MTDNLRGRVWMFGDDINTDLIIPSFAVFFPRTEQPKHCFSGLRPGWVEQVQVGDILIAGRNFGVGGGRNIGDIFQQLGIRLIVAESFNGLGLRNCVNVGLPVLPCRGVREAFKEGEIAEVDWTGGSVRNATSGVRLQGQPLPKSLRDLIQSGGVEIVLQEQGFLSAAAANDRR